MGRSQAPFPAAWTDTYAGIFGMVTGLELARGAGAPGRSPGKAASNAGSGPGHRYRRGGCVVRGALRQRLARTDPVAQRPVHAVRHREVDTEWRSDWKWDRLAPHIRPLAGRRVLDVGCGSGYHLWRMRGAGAELAVGVDPTLIFAVQFFAGWRICWAPRRMPG